MEERDDLEQMAFIQKWNDGKAAKRIYNGCKSFKDSFG